jgi:hypothetical protein
MGACASSSSRAARRARRGASTRPDDELRAALDACARAMATKLELERALRRGFLALARARRDDGRACVAVDARRARTRVIEALEGRRATATAAASNRAPRGRAVREARAAFEDAARLACEACDADDAVRALT